ncbi:hypothetical protein VCRA2122O12_150038 [Vibrio crassostreae]|nr:hypothetical protein VCRA2110O1_150060 [Vibrio crassostreae]CAK1777897.1 hypothetical protein VCRA2110O4_150059 [Vibrio crassostreae]CAK1816978.1 hypothetical protein VCRA2114E5_170060 [Vibrio crassostreae]CAK2578866.1 hypothetical protein VCRA2110O3_160038 [Vibrio crassostreae]CAK2590903.1 hypothetical protein VCRA2110O2_160059 [Vibrio crassostreae]
MRALNFIRIQPKYKNREAKIPVRTLVISKYSEMKNHSWRIIILAKL